MQCARYRALTLKSKKTIKGLQMKVELTKDELAKESEKAQVCWAI